MGLETPTYIDDLNALWPLGTDQKSQGDDHIRNIKAALKATFPNADQAYTLSDLTAIAGIKDMLASTGALAPHKNLVNKPNSTNPNYQVDIDADAIALFDSSDNLYLAESVNLTVDITASGANGLDTGSEASSTWYYLWAIYNGSTVAGLISASSTAPTLPSGYTYKGLVGAFYNDSSSDIHNFLQNDTSAIITTITDLSGGTASGGGTAVSLSVPPIARRVQGTIYVYDTGSAALGEIYPTSDVDFGRTYFGMRASGSTNAISRGHFSMQLIESQTIYYEVTSGQNLSIYTNGWEY